MKTQLLLACQLGLILLFTFSCSCEADNAPAESAKVENNTEEDAAREVAEAEFRKRNRPRGRISSRVFGTMQTPNGVAYEFVVFQEPAVPGAHMYITVLGKKVIKYEGGK